MLKKILAVLSVTVLMLTCFCINVSADVGDNKVYEVESNNSYALADSIYNDDTVYATIRSRSDIDYFKFTLYSRSSVSVLSCTDTAAVIMGIFDSNDECVYATSPFYYNGSYFIDMKTTLSAGTYYVIVLYSTDYYFYSEKAYLFHLTYTSSTTHTHTYDNACDSSCNGCGAIRSVTHTYSNACDTTCNICYTTRTTSHSYSNNCDTSCNVCGVTRVTSHNYNWVIDKNATCVGTGTKHEECSVCGLKRNENTIISAKGHNWDNGYISKEPTCGSEGQRTYSCETCLFMKTEPIARTNNHVYTNSCDTTCNGCGAVREASHDFEWIVDIEETCTKSGSKHEECQDCGFTRNEDTIIKAKGHNWDSGFVSIEPTCATTGEMTYSCETCLTTKTEAIACTNDHVYTDDCDASCDLCGSNRKPKHNFAGDDVCDDCGYVQEFEIGDVNGDGTVNVSDLADLKKCLAGLLSSEESASLNADLNGDGTVNVSDLADLKKMLAGLV